MHIHTYGEVREQRVGKSEKMIGGARRGSPTKASRVERRGGEEEQDRRRQSARAPLVSFRFLIRTSFGTLGFK